MFEWLRTKRPKRDELPYFRLTVRQKTEGIIEAKAETKGKPDSIVMMGVAGMAMMANHLIETQNFTRDQLMESFEAAMDKFVMENAQREIFN